jgi:hypothetical protein
MGEDRTGGHRLRSGAYDGLMGAPNGQSRMPASPTIGESGVGKPAGRAPWPPPARATPMGPSGPRGGGVPVSFFNVVVNGGWWARRVGRVGRHGWVTKKKFDFRRNVC